MALPDRRSLLIGITGAVSGAAISGVAMAAGEAGTLADAVRSALSDLDATLRDSSVTSAELRQLFANGAEIVEPITAGRYIIVPNPVRALVLLAIRFQGAHFDIPTIATFAGASPADLHLVSLESAPGDPFDALQSPAVKSGTDSRRSDMPDLQLQYDRLAAAGGGTLAVPAGRFATNLVLHSRRVHISGAGRGATLLTPLNPKRPVLRAAYRDGSWNYVTIANLDITGIGGHGVGFRAGSDSYVAGDEFAGRTRFVNIGFTDLDVAIHRTAGQIGLFIDQCCFGPCESAVFSVANHPGRGEIMHAGILTARDCHFTGARQAVAYFNSTVVGTGGVLFDNCIMERNPGFVFYVDGFADVEGVTDFVVRDCWNEQNATAGSVVVGGQREQVFYGSFSNAGMIRFEGTPLGSLRLRNAVVETYGCPLDALSNVDMDSESTLQHHEARGFGSYAPIGTVTSVASAGQSEPPGRALTFVIPNRRFIKAFDRSAVRLSSPASQPMTLVGSVSVKTHSVDDAILPGFSTSQSVSLKKGMQVFPSPVPIAPESWVVWLLSYRLIAGIGPYFQVSGDRGISARRQLVKLQWETLGGMAEVAPGAKEISLWLVQEAPSATVLLGGYNLLQFNTRQAALEFLNSGAFALTG